VESITAVGRSDRSSFNKKNDRSSLALGDGDRLPFGDRESIASGRIDRAPSEFSLVGWPT
jgi:hypothetical protein